MATPTPVFPAAIATDAQLKIANNLVKTSLKVGAAPTDTILFVNSTAGFVPNCLVSIDKEIIAVSSIAGGPNPSLLVAPGGRGFDGTTAAQHSPGAQVSMFIDAWHHNALATEVKAIEAALGPNLQNVAGAWQVLSTQYIFAPQQPGVSLVPGNNAITLSPVPAGVNGTDVGHYLWVTGGTGTPEKVLIVGGTAVGGAPSGQLIIQAANAHSGAWTIQSATAGIQEAINTLPASGGQVIVPPGSYPLNADVNYAGKTGVSVAIAPGVTFTGTGHLPAAVLPSQNTISYSYIGPGTVVMRHDPQGGWGVMKPDGSMLNVAGTTTQGLQEAINYAKANQYKLYVYGGGPNFAFITCSSTLAFPPGWQSEYEFSGIFLLLNTGAADGLTFDSCDLTNVNFHNCQIVYSGTAAAVHFNPTADMGENFAGFTTSNFDLGHVVCCVSPSNLVPDTSKGICVRISAPALGLGLANGNGIFVNCKVTGTELNSGLIGLQIDTPGGSGSVFEGNTVAFTVIHGQGSVSFLEGTSAAAAGRIVGNKYTFPIVSNALGASLWGGSNINAGGNLYEFPHMQAGTTAITFNSSAAGARVIVGFIAASAPNYVNNATLNSNKVFDTVTPIAHGLTIGASPWTWINNTLKDVVFSIFGGTVSRVDYASDAAGFNQISAASAVTIPVQVGAAVKITYSAAPLPIAFY